MRSGIGSRQHQCEVPSRARGRVVVHTIHSRVLGNTPACAGEERDHRRFRPLDLEIPPRARGRGSPYPWQRVGNGNTPACAGKSDRLDRAARHPRKYPRVRGEEEIPKGGTLSYMEIPPRARGRVIDWIERQGIRGNTPACAGKRPPSRATMRAIRKYPRVRGEETRALSAMTAVREIPPRARGRGNLDRHTPGVRGNTPACAGKRNLMHSHSRWGRKYPRVRGEEQV